MMRNLIFSIGPLLLSISFMSQVFAVSLGTVSTKGVSLRTMTSGADSSMPVTSSGVKSGTEVLEEIVALDFSGKYGGAVSIGVNWASASTPVELGTSLNEAGGDFIGINIGDAEPGAQIAVELYREGESAKAGYYVYEVQPDSLLEVSLGDYPGLSADDVLGKVVVSYGEEYYGKTINDMIDPSVSAAACDPWSVGIYNYSNIGNDIESVEGPADEITAGERVSVGELYITWSGCYDQGVAASVAGYIDEIEGSGYDSIELTINNAPAGKEIMVQLLDSEKSPGSSSGVSDVYTLKGEESERIVIPLAEFKGINKAEISYVTVHSGETAFGRDLEMKGVMYPEVVDVAFLKTETNVETPGTERENEIGAQGEVIEVNEQGLQWLRDNIGDRGLVVSHPGAGVNSYTYDNALASLVLMNTGDEGDMEKAARMLDFFREDAQSVKVGDGSMVYNAYSNVTGYRATEKVVHLGPNAWIALAMAHFNEMNPDKGDPYLESIINIGEAVVSLQNADGSIQMGPGDTRVSTEQNIDSYALLDYLAEKTGDDKYVSARDKLAAWLTEDIGDGQRIELVTGVETDGAINWTPATDVLAWGSSIDLETVDKSALLDRAENLTSVTITCKDSEGTEVEISGYSFSVAKGKGDDPANGQDVITPEWSAEMALAYKEIGDDDKANEILANLELLRDSGGGLPYATKSCFNTWVIGTTVDTDKAPSSVAPTAYVALAQMGFNPLSFE